LFKEKQKNGVWASVFIIIGIFILISLLFYTPSKSSIFTSHPQISSSNYIGRLGIFIATYLYLALGIGAFLLPLVMLKMSIVKFKRGKIEIFSRKGIGVLLFFIAFCSSLYLMGLDIKFYFYGGGILGFFFLKKVFLPLFGTVGTPVILIGIFLLSILLSIDLSPLMAKRKIRKSLPLKKRAFPIEKIEKDKMIKDRDGKEDSSFALPPLHLLNKIPKQEKANDEVKIAGGKLKQTLKDFGVEVDIAEIKEGPAITRFEIKLAPGIKVNKVMRLSDDLALSLAVSNIRIEVPVSGKSLIGIEVPKKKVNFVYLKELLEEKKFRESKAKLLLPLGKNIAGEPVWINLESLPHLLIGGSTGSGKSACINSLIISILYKSFPEKVKFLLIDPKTVELADYIDIPHLLFPPIKEVKEANSALEWVVEEMKRRYERFNAMGERNITGYNREAAIRKEQKIPYLVVIIDELADLIMLAGARLEKTLCRIAQLGRATGIHLIVATQRPSVDVITGLIKANFPSRISFAVASQVDSRTILDAVGAEKLIGNGDMLYSPVQASKPIRVQGSFVSPQEIKRVVNFIRNQQKPIYKEIIKEVEEKKEEKKKEEHRDKLYSEAKNLVIRRGKASTSFLQRRLSIGYNRAARIMEELEKDGIVGPQKGSKARDVLLGKE